MQAAESATDVASERGAAVSAAAQSAAMGESAAETRKRAAGRAAGPQARAETRKSAAPTEPERQAILCAELVPRARAASFRAAFRLRPLTVEAIQQASTSLGDLAEGRRAQQHATGGQAPHYPAVKSCA